VTKVTVELFLNMFYIFLGIIYLLLLINRHWTKRKKKCKKYLFDLQKRNKYYNQFCLYGGTSHKTFKLRGRLRAIMDKLIFIPSLFICFPLGKITVRFVCFLLHLITNRYYKKDNPKLYARIKWRNNLKKLQNKTQQYFCDKGLEHKSKLKSFER